MKRVFVYFVVIFLVWVLPSGCSNRAQELQNYRVKAQSLGELIAGQAQACVSQSKAYEAAWEYAKVTEMDFKTAADQILGSEMEQNKVRMKERRTMIENLLDELKEPPSQFVEMHKILGELYEIYVALHDLAMDPLGDREKHMKAVNELNNKIAEKKRELDAEWALK